MSRSSFLEERDSQISSLDPNRLCDQNSLVKCPKEIPTQAYWSCVERLCVKRGFSLQDLAKRACVSRTTLHHWSTGETSAPRLSTIHKIAQALDVPVEVLIEGASFVEEQSGASSEMAEKRTQGLFSLAENFHERRRQFDRLTNPIVDEVHSEHPDLFEDWTLAEWDELFSCFGTGGALNSEGVMSAAEEINSKRATIHQLEILLETDHQEMIKAIIATFYQTVQVNSQ